MDQRPADMSTNEESAVKRPRRRLTGSFLIGMIAVLILISAAAVFSYTRFLNQQLFLERQTHLLEISEKIAEIVDVVIDSSWDSVFTCEQLLYDADASSQEALLDSLSDMNRYVRADDTIIFAFDSMASYYASDGHAGHWTDPSAFLPFAPDMQVTVASLPYLNANETYMMFILRMDSPIIIEQTGKKITHIAAAIEIETLRQTFAVTGFDESCYTYIVNSDGRRLFKNTHLQTFIEGYNIITSMENYEVVNGSSMDDLRAAIGNETSACLEFLYGDRNYFVGTSLVPSVNWEVMLFVPTDVLGANTNVLLGRTSQFFFIIGAIVLTMFCVLLISITSSYNDKKLVRQQRQTNALLARAAEESDAANRAKSKFLSRMSHDIRTPINGIMGMTDIASKNINDPEKAAECLGKIDTASRHLLSLINDVLDMSSIESGKTVLSRDPVDLRTILGNCTSIITGQLEGRDVDFIVDFEEFEHPALLGDELRLRQILINILGNAVKFTPDGGKIFFRVRELSAPEGKARFSFIVEDTGIGMSEEFLSRIFEPFSQEDGRDRSTYPGTGLGMAITKQFVDLMGGTIAAESKLHRGSRFTVILSTDIDADSRIEHEHEHSVLNLSGMRVLLVEDNELNIEIAKYMLEEESVLVTVAKNGRQAVEAYEQAEPGYFEAILMDIMMPVMDGMEAAKLIRALPREDAAAVPIIAMTANAYEEDKKRTRAAGMNEHLSKPIDRDILLKTLSLYHESHS